MGSTLHDIKRDGEALAAELGEEKETIDAIFAGNVSEEIFDNLI